MKKHYFLFFILLLSYSCTNKSELINFDQIVNTDCKIIAKNIEIGLALELRYYNNKILINDFFGDSLISIYDISKSVIERKIAIKGEGPYEFMSPLEIAVSDSVIYMYERSKFTKSKLIFSSDFQSIRITKKTKIPAEINNICVISDREFIASGIFKKNRFALLDSTGKIIKYFGSFPDYWSEEKNIPVEAKAMFHQNRFIINNKKKLFASISSNVIEIYSYSSNNFDRKYQALLSPYEYTYSTGDILFANRKKDVARAVIDANCTDKYIYLVYDPNPEKVKGETAKKRLNNEIWIFDWTGKPIKLIRPDMNVKNICIDAKDKQAYCIVETPEPTIAMFEL